MSKTDAPETNGEKRKPIPVAVIRFTQPMDAMGLSVASSCSSKDDTFPGRRHQLSYLPWMRHFRVEFFPGGGEPSKVSMIHEAMAKSWEPAQE